MSRTFRFLVRGFAVAPLLLAAACGLQTSGVGPGDGDTGLPEAGDGDVLPADDGADETTPTEDVGEVPDTPPAECGNGITETPEECDDGNPDDADECPTTCRTATCGDGFVRTGLEDCDDGPDNSDSAPNACRTDCAAPGCGDGVVDTGEACDDGNTDDGDDCHNDCRSRHCGNGTVDSGEECDDGNPDNTDNCLVTCVAASCGDGYLWAGTEECDGDSTTCDTSCGSVGRRDCIACVWSPTCTPPVETCNGTDDDCDGAADNGFACEAGEPAPCATFCGSTGTGTCSAGCLPADPALCAAPAEICNGADDDCDGQTDEGFPLFCNLPGGHTVVDLCVDPGETPCNGIDDNCNGTTDEGSECVPGASRACTNACGVAGSQGCTSTCGWGACCAATEICQPSGTPCDDDCDGEVDEGCGIVAPPNDTCATATVITPGTITGNTTPAAHDGTPSCATGSGSGSGRDLWYTFTLAERRLVYLDVAGGAPWDTVLEVRSGGCPGTVVTNGCNDDRCGNRSQLMLVLPAGTYRVLVDGYNDAAHGPFELFFQTSYCILNRISANGDHDGNTSGHGAALRGSCGGTSAEEDGYVFGLCQPTAVTAHTCSSATAYDTVLYYRSGDCLDASPELACNNNSTCGATTVGASRISATLLKGLSFVIVDGASGAAGAYRLNISGLP